MPDVYMVCAQSDIDGTTGQCTHVQYVQAPLLIPPLDAQAGMELGMGFFAVCCLAACWKKLSDW